MAIIKNPQKYLIEVVLENPTSNISYNGLNNGIDLKPDLCSAACRYNNSSKNYCIHTIRTYNDRITFILNVRPNEEPKVENIIAPLSKILYHDSDFNWSSLSKTTGRLFTIQNVSRIPS